MNATLAEALLRTIVEAQEAFFEAAELVSIGVITPERYQSAADRFHDSIDRAADCLPPTVETATPTMETRVSTMRRAVIDDELLFLADYQG